MTRAASERKFEVSILVDSEEHSLAELVAMLSLSPDESWEKGEKYVRRGHTKYRAASRWALVERDVDIEDWSVTIDRLIQRLRPVEPAFHSLPSGVYVRLMMCVTEDNDVFGLGLHRRHVLFAASIGAELDMSFVVRVRTGDG